VSQLVFDIEADALDAREVTRVWCIVIQDVDTEELFKYGPTEIEAGIKRLEVADRLIAHNCIGYDLPVLKRVYDFTPKGRVIDTLVLSRLANPDRAMPYGMPGKRVPHSIAAWGRRLGREKPEHEEWDRYSEAMMERCTQDVLINTQVLKALYHEFRE
jgi:DNA polymerase-1